MENMAKVTLSQSPVKHFLLKFDGTGLRSARVS